MRDVFSCRKIHLKSYLRACSISRDQVKTRFSCTKTYSGYHRRSLAESGASRYKRILGPQLAARSWAGQQTKARIGCVILNRMIHLGKLDTYRVEGSV